MSLEKVDNVEEQPLVVVVFDRANGRYCVDSGPWVRHGFVGPKGSEREDCGDDPHTPHSRTPESHNPQSPAPQSPPPESPTGSPPSTNEDVMRCLRSLLAGHTTHCHWHVWTGSKWKDTGMENCGTC
jgi:hypothetical protein